MWKGKVAAWRESTTTLPSVRHLGHFKALIRHFEEDPNTDEGKIMYQKQNDAHIVLLFLASTGKSLLQPLNRGDFSIKDYMGTGGIQRKNALADQRA
eukprot:5555956-Ditylum_brightwellii.AAC.1